MDYAAVRERALRELTPIVEALGYEVIDIECKNMYKQNQITVFIYKKEGITLEDCEKVSNALDTPLEEMDITAGEAYNLNISSPGLDRPIVTDRDMERNLGLEVEMKVKTQVNKKNKLEGVLKAYTPETVIITAINKDITVERNNIKLMTQQIKFK